MASEELVDIVDEHDRVVDTVARRVMRASDLRHRAVYIAVVSSDGRLLVHQRSFEKDVAPGWWDVAVGGVVVAGEGYDESAVREVAEEIGVHVRIARPGEAADTGDAHGADDAADVPVLEPLGPVRYEEPPTRIVGRAYRLVHDGPFIFADGEVIAAEWMTPEQLAAAVDDRSREICPDSFAVLFPLLGFPGTHIGRP